MNQGKEIAWDAAVYRLHSELLEERNLFPWTDFTKPKQIMAALYEHSPVQAGNMPSESPLLPQLLWKLVKLVQSIKNKHMQNLSLKNWPYQKLQQWMFHQHCHYNEVVNPLEFSLEWDNILGPRTSQRQFWHTTVETNKPARRSLYCVASGRSTGYRNAPWKFPTIEHFPKYRGENYE